MEIPIKMDDLGVPLFLETPIFVFLPEGPEHLHNYTSHHDLMIAGCPGE